MGVPLFGSYSIGLFPIHLFNLFIFFVHLFNGKQRSTVYGVGPPFMLSTALYFIYSTNLFFIYINLVQILGAKVVSFPSPTCTYVLTSFGFIEGLLIISYMDFARYCMYL